jgi:hypothetical protein
MKLMYKKNLSHAKKNHNHSINSLKTFIKPYMFHNQKYQVITL